MGLVAGPAHGRRRRKRVPHRRVCRRGGRADKDMNLIFFALFVAVVLQATPTRAALPPNNRLAGLVDRCVQCCWTFPLTAYAGLVGTELALVFLA